MSISVPKHMSLPNARAERRAGERDPNGHDVPGVAPRWRTSAIRRLILKSAPILFVLLAVCPASAASADLLRPQGIEANLAVAWFDYEEPGLMNEYGFLPGIGIRARFRPAVPGIVFDAQAEVFGGVLTYDGEYQDGTPLKTDTVDVLTEERGVIGYDLLGKNWRLTPYLGLGHRYWFDRIQAAGGYRREIRYLFAPMGLEAAWRFNSSVVMGVRGEYDLFLQGWVTSHLSDVNTQWDDAENDQDFGSGHGLRGAVFAIWPMGRNQALTWEAFARYWWVGDSNRAVVAGPDDPNTLEIERRYYVWEPENETVMLGFTLALAF